MQSFFIAILLHLGSKHKNLINEDQNDVARQFSRRSFLTVGNMGAVALLTSQGAEAAPPMTREEVESPLARFERRMRKAPAVRSLRPELELDFAVLLMRSSYDALDQLDCVAMDQFQRDFFIFRQAEYETYQKELGPGMIYQGPNRKNPDIMCPCISDPYYFDFLSFAQYATINREITKDPLLIFEERADDGVNLTPRVVRRDPTLTNNLLASTHERLVGDAIVNRFEDLVGPVVGQEKTLLELLTLLIQFFVINGYARDGKVTGTSQQVEIELQAPATLWSGTALQFRHSQLHNSFVSKAAESLVTRLGFVVQKSVIRYQDTRETIQLQIRER